MEIRQLPAEEAAVRRYAEELWIPYNRELETVVESHVLADDVDLVTEQVPWALEKLETSEYRIAVAVDTDDGIGPIAGTDAPFAGFVATDLDPCPSVFDRPDRVVVCDIYVREPYRGTGLARDLVERAETRADEANCSELVLSVDVDNERALAFYEKCGFEPLRRRLVYSVDASKKSV